jgi:polysaccharide export outer membrane protein
MTPRARPHIAPLLLAGLVLLQGCEGYRLPVATAQGIGAPVSADLSPMPERQIDPSLLLPPTTPYRIGPGDQLELEVMGEAATRTTVTVGPDGKIYYNLLPGIDVWGLTVPEAADLIENEFRTYIRAKPAVTLTVRTAASQQVWVLGRVNSPGVYSLGGPTSLLDVVSEAGGLGVNTPAGGMYSEVADLPRSFLVRDGHLVPVDFQRLLRDGDLSQNVYLQTGDFVYVPSLHSSQVHVLGAVLQPRSERMNGALTLVQAIALAGGTVPTACLPNVAILRGSLAHPRIAIVAVNNVLRGKAPDVRLEPGDIVYVPFAPDRILVRYVNLILDTFVRTVGVNEGAYAISNKVAPVTVGVNLTP